MLYSRFQFARHGTFAGSTCKQSGMSYDDLEIALGDPDLAVLWIDTWQVDFRDKLQTRRCIRIVFSTMNVYAVYPILM